MGSTTPLVAVVDESELDALVVLDALVALDALVVLDALAASVEAGAGVVVTVCVPSGLVVIVEIDPSGLICVMVVCVEDDPEDPPPEPPLPAAVVEVEDDVV